MADLAAARGGLARNRYAGTAQERLSGGALEPDMQRSAEKLLKLYLGERTGERVLAGRTKRGKGEKIHAVIWLCDLRDSTRLPKRLR